MSFIKSTCILIPALVSFVAFSQKDSLAIGHRYLEDQIYVSASYNLLIDQPDNFSSSGFSYEISTGFIKDIPLNKQGNLAIGLGIGYGFNSFNHDFKISENNSTTIFEVNTESANTNRFQLHNLELPIEFRWRTSTAQRYSFWRIYAGAKITYNFKNTFNYDLQEFTNVERFNTWQTGLTLGAGYDVFNIYFYYGLSPILNDASQGITTINTKIIKIGMIFYIL